MINFPEPDDKRCLQLLEASRPYLESLSNEMKIDFVQADYFSEIVVPLSVYLLNLPERKAILYWPKWRPRIRKNHFI